MLLKINRPTQQISFSLLDGDPVLACYHHWECLHGIDISHLSWSSLVEGDPVLASYHHWEFLHGGDVSHFSQLSLVEGDPVLASYQYCQSDLYYHWEFFIMGQLTFPICLSFLWWKGIPKCWPTIIIENFFMRLMFSICLSFLWWKGSQTFPILKHTSFP